MVQKLILPFGRLNYLPLEQQFMPCLERILAREAGMAPLATVNILMSLCQLQCLPFRALQFVFSPSFINHINGMHTEWLVGPRAVGPEHAQVSAAQCPPVPASQQAPLLL